MRVEYKPTVLQQISVARKEALRTDKEIARIVLTVKEARELVDECFAGNWTGVVCEFERWLHCAERFVADGIPLAHLSPQPLLRVFGVDIKVEAK